MQLKDKMIQVVEENYDLGKVIDIWQYLAGATNKSFGILCEKNGEQTKYFCRQYHFSKTEDDIRYEFGLTEHIDKKAAGKFLVPLAVAGKDGRKCYLSEFEGVENYYAVSGHLEGFEPYNWLHVDYLVKTSENAFIGNANAVAKVQSYAYDYKAPSDIVRPEPDLLEQIVAWQEEIPGYVAALKERPTARKFYEYLHKKYDYILNMMAFCEAETKKALNKLPTCIIHGDLQTSNLLYDEDDNVIGAFDFDWASKGTRLYDVAWCSIILVTSWAEETLGHSSIPKLKRFLEHYNDAIRSCDTALPELTQDEYDFFPVMLLITTLKIIYDFIREQYEDPGRNAYEWYVMTHKYVCMVEWYYENLEELKKLNPKS
jgi:homoserine kinase type II